MIFTARIPYPPTVNHYYVRTRRGMVVGKRGVKYREKIAAMQGPKEKFTGRISVKLRCFFPDRRKRDLDNLNKCTLDALQKAGWYEDDSDIWDLRLIRDEIIVKGGLIVVTISHRSKEKFDES
jgi:crossover junction endodeoxyribonuclease RusA